MMLVDTTTAIIITIIDIAEQVTHRNLLPLLFLTSQHTTGIVQPIPPFLYQLNLWPSSLVNTIIHMDYSNHQLNNLLVYMQKHIAILFEVIQAYQLTSYSRQLLALEFQGLLFSSSSLFHNCQSDERKHLTHFSSQEIQFSFQLPNQVALQLVYFFQHKLH